MRSVHFGCSRYSRRCYLLVALSFHWVAGRESGQWRSRRNSAYGPGAFKPISELCCSLFRHPGMVKRLVSLATDP
jgi:hypothetical protein